MHSWMSSERSGVIWVDTYRDSKQDWTSAFARHLVDDCARLEYPTVLCHFCQGHSTDGAVSTATRVIQSLIFKCLLLHREKFTVPATKYTQKRFEEVQEDVEGLWTLLLDVITTAEARCIWIVVDHIDILQKETHLKGLENTLAFLRNLNLLADDIDTTVKILVTARVHGPRLSIKMAEAKILSPRHTVVVVPRGNHRREATLVALSSERNHALTQDKSGKALYPPDSLLPVDALLSATDSDSDFAAQEGGEAYHLSHEKSKSLTVPGAVDDGVTDLGSDSSFGDPLASSDDDQEFVNRDKKAMGPKHAPLHSSSSEDSLIGVSSKDDALRARPFNGFTEDIRWGSETDDENEASNRVTSHVRPRIVIRHSDHSPCSPYSRVGTVDNEAGRNQPVILPTTAADSVSDETTRHDLSSESDGII